MLVATQLQQQTVTVSNVVAATAGTITCNGGTTTILWQQQAVLHRMLAQ
jgi:hypothetical protein